METPRIVMQAKGLVKRYGQVTAIAGADFELRAGEILAVIGDNGAGKSTLIKILSGVHKPSSGSVTLDGEPVEFSSPRDALGRGIATVFQDLATVPLMSIWRNFFLGNEPVSGPKALGLLSVKNAKDVTKSALKQMGIDLRDTDQPIGTLSGGERQAVAIARAVHFGAKVLILDEPTSALGVRQSGIVLKYILAARDRGVAVVFITHNPHHAFMVGDRFYLLNRGRLLAEFERGKVQLEELIQAMAGGAELESLAHEISSIRA
jgi:simple sugar transport system ATP-binding protein